METLTKPYRASEKGGRGAINQNYKGSRGITTHNPNGYRGTQTNLNKQHSKEILVYLVKGFLEI